MRTKLKNFVVAGLFALTTAFLGNAYADDIFKGIRGPTPIQIDERISYSRNDKNLEATTNNLIFKYWDGEGFGKWAFLNIPYKLVNSPKGSNNGIGDVSFGLGPRISVEEYNLFLYLGLNFPSGNFEANVPLGSGRVDEKTGALFTYLSSNKKFEIDVTLEYSFTGDNNKKINPPDEIYAGMLGGLGVFDNVRIATGFSDLIKTNGDYIINFRSVLRYTLSQELHFELLGDVAVNATNIPKSNAASVFLRYNM